MDRSRQFRDLCSGSRRGVAASFARGLMHAAEVPYAAAVRWRNRRYDRQHATIHRVGVPVISIGNLTLGGTGKTPLVAWTARWLAARGLAVAIVSRGYRARENGLNDEARLLQLALPDVPHVQKPDRVAAAEQAIQDFGAEVILLDDGFQHRRLARDLDIVLIDALQPFGFDHVFPRGMLREPLAALARGDLIVLNRADLVGPETIESIWRRIERFAPQRVRIQASQNPESLVDTAGNVAAIASLAGRRVAAFCGIGNPSGFRQTLLRCGLQLVAWREFADHHPYAHDELEGLAVWAVSHEAEAVLCTQKDMVKIAPSAWRQPPLWALAIQTQFQTGGSALEQALLTAVSQQQ